MHSVNFIDILKSYVWHDSVQVCHLLGATVPGSNPAANDKLFEGCLTLQLPHEIIWNANLMQQGDFINVFLARPIATI